MSACWGGLNYCILLAYSNEFNFWLTLGFWNCDSVPGLRLDNTRYIILINILYRNKIICTTYATFTIINH